jgi:membrane associated rhomboid family serine protease
MLIIPVTGKLNKKNLPWITIIIILINCFVFFYFQSDDDKFEQEASTYYFNSGLAEIEVNQYIKYREEQKDALQDIKQQEQQTDSDSEKMKRYYHEMFQDEEFEKLLLSDKIITPADPQYKVWKDLRTQYGNISNNISSEKYGFIPANNKPITIFTSMFLHGSFMHLLGNMIFLWLVGCILELGFGRITYIVIYFLSGVFETELFRFFNMDSIIPLIGASGAISGLMGAYTVAYGRTKINVFYSLGFYFNYARVYAILLLPLWLANETFALLFLKNSNVAYLAHIGGLIGGAFLGFLSIKIFRIASHKDFEDVPDPKKTITTLLEKALQKIESLDMKGARPLLLDILAIDANNSVALKHLYNIDKLQLTSDEFHKTAVKRMLVLSREAGSEKTLFDTYKEYCRLADKPRISADMLLYLCHVFTSSEKLDYAETILDHVFSIAPNHPRLAQSLLETAQANVRKGKKENSTRLLQTIQEHFPNSPEAAIAGKLSK